MIKVISFDIGGTLFKNNTIDNYSINALSLLLNKPYELVMEAYKDVFQKQKGTFDELVNMFCKYLNVERNTNIDNFFYNKFNSDEGTISKDSIYIIKELKDKGYKVILFSNSCCLFKSVVSEELKHMVDGIFYSFEIGYTKSDSESYKIIENKLGNKADEFLHIGDTLKSDYFKPLENGWHALYYGDTSDNNIHTIKRLNKIFNYLK